MPKRRLEDTLADLRRLKAGPIDADAIRELRRVLAHEICFAVVRAAEVVAAREIVDLGDDLAAAFPRFLQGLPKSDPGCGAKLAIARALRTIGHPDATTLLAGVRHVQMEPAFGGSPAGGPYHADTAAELRAECVLGLAELRHPDVLLHIADLLADPEPTARAGAARAVAVRGLRESLALLRLRVRVGDDDPRVLGECLDAMFALDAAGSLPFASDLLDRGGDAAEAAALALGSSRLAAALPTLRAWLERSPGALRTGLTAIATLRREEAFSYLIELVASGDRRHAVEALKALAPQRADEALAGRVRAAVVERGDPKLRDAFEEGFRLSTF